MTVSLPEPAFATRRNDPRTMVNYNIRGTGFKVRRAADVDAKALRMLLPALRDASIAFVAEDLEHQLVIGAAAITRSQRPTPLAGPGVAIEVIAPCRCWGVGTALLLELERAARAAGAKALYAAQRVDAGSAEMQAWQRLGFEPCETVEEHILPLKHIEQRLAPLVERLRRRGRIPAGARVIPLYQANLAAVLQLHLDQMGGDRRELYRKLRSRGAGAFLPRESKVLLVDEQVKGCLLARRTAKETIVVDANIVDPALRGGWANAWLKLESFRGAPAGVTEFRFTSFEHYADTRSFTTKLGGRTARSTVLMMRPIANNH